MKKTLIIISIFAMSLNASFAQLTIALHHNGQGSYYSSFDSLKNHIQSGDTIYLPGGGFNIGNWNIDKTVHVFGVGHNPDSTTTTGTTYLSGNIILKTGADNSFFQGFYLTGNIIFGTNVSDQIVNNTIISRCNLTNIYLSFDGTTTTSSSNISIRENIVRGTLSGGFAANVSISNNIIQGLVQYFNSMLFSNNIMMGGFCNNGPFNNNNFSTFQNNILIQQYYNCSGNYLESSCNSNYFANNIFNQPHAFPYNSSTGNGNWLGIDLSTVIVGQSGLSFDYVQNYHLISPSTYLGTDGTQVGIYGGVYPFKEGSVPQNPHVISKTIQQSTDNSGNLNINVKVKAQNN
jgi:hypothetical protein